MSKFIKYGIILIVVALLVYNSIYIKKLSEINQSASGKFDATTFTKKLWEEKLPSKLDSAIAITSLKKMIETDAVAAFAKHTNAMAIGNYRYALIKGTAVVNEINVDDILITMQADQPFKALLLTEFIYGNTLRDASTLVDLKEFPNTSELNLVSEEFNKRIRGNVIPAFKSLVKPGNKIEFTGAVELNKEHIRFDNIEIVPVRVKILP